MYRIIFFLILVTFSSANVISDIPKVYRWFVGTPKKPINSALSNRVHPKTNVKFNAKGYPMFEKTYVCNMQLSWFSRKWDSMTMSDQAVRQKHFALCSKQLYQKLGEASLRNMKFTSSQIEHLKQGKTPEGFTWHHSEKKNILELVDRHIHNATAHSGGFSLHHKF